LPKYYAESTSYLKYNPKTKLGQGQSINPKGKTQYVKPELTEKVKVLSTMLAKKLSKKGYSPKTIKSYSDQLTRFLYYSHLNWDIEYINTYVLYTLGDKKGLVH